MNRGFPKDFTWGCATSAYQVEGAVGEDGRGPTIWDTFSHLPGRTHEGHSGDRACDQYHRIEEDVRLMKDLGIRAYRFSIAWTRILPNGEGTVNEKGVAFYLRLLDALQNAGIEPWITLFHWDLPQALEDRYGGWRSRETSKRFGDYAGIVMDRFSDRVSHWFTTNEFRNFTDSGYFEGCMAPGAKESLQVLYGIRHHALLGHGLALQAIRARAKRKPVAGLAEDPASCTPIWATEENIDAARKAMRLTNKCFLTPIMEGKYPEEYLEEMGANAPLISPQDFEAISAPIDVLGLNVYRPVYIRAVADKREGYEIVKASDSHPKLGPFWLEFDPQCIYWTVRFVHELWHQKNMVISENGCAGADKINDKGEVVDTDRILCLRSTLEWLNRAIVEGAPVNGYFHWSFMDNFEWAAGYSNRFGLCHVNFETQKRTPKLSASFYREVIKQNSLV